MINFLLQFIFSFSYRVHAAVSKHVTLWMRQTGSEGRGEAGKCIILLYIDLICTKLLSHRIGGMNYYIRLTVKKKS